MIISPRRISKKIIFNRESGYIRETEAFIVVGDGGDMMVNSSEDWSAKKSNESA